VESGMSAAPSSGGNDPGFSGDELPLRRMGDGSDEDIVSDAFSLAMAPGKWSSSATAESVASMAEYRKETIGQTTADLGAEIMREMEEVERIATSSSNLKGTLRRLQQTSRKVRAIGAELQQRTVVPVGYPINTDGKSKMEEELARLRSRVRELGDEVSRILVTVGQWLGTAVGKKAKEDEMRTTMGSERGAKRMTPGVLTAIMGSPHSPPPHPQPGPSCPRGSGGASGVKEGDGNTGPRVSLDDPRDQGPPPVAGRSSRDGAASRASAPPGIRAEKDTSRSTAVSSADETDFIPVVRRRGRRRGGALPSSASLLTAGDGGILRGVAPHGGGPASREETKEDARSGANLRRKGEVARRTGNASRTSAPGTYAQAAAQPLNSRGENRSLRSRIQQAGRTPVQVGGVGLSGLDAGGRGSHPRPPRSAAVSVTVPENAAITYAEAMTRVRREVSLDELQVTDIRPRRAETGALILEIPGREGGHEKASLLAEHVANVLRDTPVKVAVPRKTAELRMTGLEDSTTLEEVVAAVVEAGGCSTGEVSAGVLRFAARGLGSVWLRCPLAAARKIIMEAGRPKVGWVRAKVHPLPARGTQCYRCLEKGHLRRDCKSEIDRSDRC
jgi:hypothetical protein